MEIVLSGENRYDNYGNFWFKDKGGKEYKIGAKNRKKDELVKVVVDNPNRAVFLTHDTVKGKDGKDYDYISGIEPLDKLIQVDETVITKPQVPLKPGVQAAPSVAPQELGMWWKEMGNRIGDGSLERDFPQIYIGIKSQYYKKLFAVTGVEKKEE